MPDQKTLVLYHYDKGLLNLLKVAPAFINVIGNHIDIRLIMHLFIKYTNWNQDKLQNSARFGFWEEMLRRSIVLLGIL